MAKKKIVKLSEEEYYRYIMGLKNDAALFNADGDVIVPDEFKKDKSNNDNKKSD